MKEFIISEKEYGQRLDKYLFKVLDRAPGGFIYKMLRKKNIVLNDRKASGREIIQEKDHIKIYLSDETFAKFASVFPGDSGRQRTDTDEKPEKKTNGIRPYTDFNSQMPDSDSQLKLEIVYEDRDILVINKPAGLLSQKASQGDDSANDRIISYLFSSGQLTKEELRTFHPSICNRLDRNTSGLLIAGKTMRGLQQMGEQLKDRSVKKYYRTLVRGRVTEPCHLCGYLVKDHRTNQVKILSCVPDDRNMESSRPGSRIETAYKPTAYFGNATLLEVHLITGRSHQIRAHLASVGHPVLGDAKYGDSSVNRELYRATGIRSQLLHAWRMELADGRILEAPVPDTFRKAEQWLCRSGLPA